MLERNVTDSAHPTPVVRNHHLYAKRDHARFLQALAKHQVIVPRHRQTIDRLAGKHLSDDLAGHPARRTGCDIAPQRHGLCVNGHEPPATAGHNHTACRGSITDDCTSTKPHAILRIQSTRLCGMQMASRTVKGRGNAWLSAHSDSWRARNCACSPARLRAAFTAVLLLLLIRALQHAQDFPPVPINQHALQRGQHVHANRIQKPRALVLKHQTTKNKPPHSEKRGGPSAGQTTG